MSVQNLVIHSSNEPDTIRFRETSPKAVEMLINPKKISADVMSLRSYSSRSTTPSTEPDPFPKAASRHRSPQTTDSDSVYSESPRQMNKPHRAASYAASESFYEDDDVTEEDDDRDEDRMRERGRELRARAEKDLAEKREILYQFDRLENRGMRLPRRFTLEDDIEEMKAELHRIERERDLQSSIRWQRMMVLSCVTGIEYLNRKFDPFNIDLDGYSERIDCDLDDYSDIFEELHEKYKSSGKKMAPELRLMMVLGGAALQTNLNNQMHRQRNIEHRPQGGSQPQQKSAPPPPPQKQNGGGFGMFDMIGSMFGFGGNRGPAPASAPGPAPVSVPQQAQRTSAPPSGPRAQPKMEGPSDVDAILQEIHGEVINTMNTQSPASMQQQRYETLSVTDTEITDLLEDAPDITGLVSAASQAKAAKRGPGRPPKNQGQNQNTRSMEI